VPTPCRVRLSGPSDNQRASLAVHNSPPAPTVAPSCLKVIEPSSLLIVRRAIHKCAITRSFARRRHRIGIDKDLGPSIRPKSLGTMRQQPSRHRSSRQTAHNLCRCLSVAFIAFRRNAWRKDLPSHRCNRSLASEAQHRVNAFLPLDGLLLSREC
jgi:hypothetical protein